MYLSTDMAMTPGQDKTVVSMSVKRAASSIARQSAVSAPLSEAVTMNYQMHMRRG